MTSTLSELTCLGLRKPGVTASPSEVADYFDAMASVHAHLAAEAAGAEATAERALCAAAYARAEGARRVAADPSTIPEQG